MPNALEIPARDCVPFRNSGFYSKLSECLSLWRPRLVLTALLRAVTDRWQPQVAAKRVPISVKKDEER